MRKPRTEIFLVVALLLAAALTYLPSLRFPFVWDDIKVVRDNPFIRSPPQIWFFFQPHFWRYRVPVAENDYRPLQMLALTAISGFAGADPLPFHLANILLHLLVGFLLYFLTRAISGDPTVALAAFSLFLFQPVHVEAIVCARNLSEFLSAVCLLLSFVCFFRWGQKPERWLWRAGALVLFAAAALCKESALVFPLLLLAFLWAERREHSLKERIAATLPFWLLAGAALIWKLSLGPGQVERRSVTLLQAVFACSKLLLVYLKLLVWPVRLHVIYSFVKPIRWTSPEWFLSLLLAGGGSIALLRLRGAGRRAAGVFLYLLISLLPALSVVGQVGRVVAEQRLYFPSLFFSLLVALGIGSLRRRLPPNRRAVLGGAVFLLCLCYAAISNRYLGCWRNDFFLWKHVAARCPGAALAHNNLAIAYHHLGDEEASEEELRRALRIDPDHSEAHLNLGVCYRSRGEWEKALAEFELSLNSAPEYDLASMNLAELRLQLGQVDKAEAAILRVLSFNPYNPEMHNALGVVRERKGDLAGAEASYRRAAELNPEYGAPLRNLADFLKDRGRYREALQTAAEAIARNPGNPLGYQNLARIFIARGDFQRAGSALQEALRLEPGNFQIRSQLMALESAGKLDKKR